MATKKANEAKDIQVSLNIKSISIPIIGISPLIVSRFDAKSARQIEENARAATGLKQGGKKKNIATPEEDYESSLYYFADGKRTGFPAGAFKAAMVTAGYRHYGKAQTILRSAFQVVADDPETNLVEIHGDHRLRCDMVRVGTINKVASPRYRAEYPEWSATITVQFLDGVISGDEIVGLLNASGFACGIGEWRPEKSNSGQYGMYKVASTY